MPDPSAPHRVRLVRSFTFEASHRLPRVPVGHKCARVHGHSYRVELVCAGPIDPDTGWLIDFADIRDAFAPVLAQLDHADLNEVPGLDNPTAELLAVWIWQHVKPDLPSLSRVVVAETGSAWCEYDGPQDN